MRAEEQAALMENYVPLIQSVHVHNISPLLIQNRILSLQDVEIIGSKSTSQDRMACLISFLCHSDRPQTFEGLLEALDEDYDFLSEKLRTTITQIRRKRRPLIRCNAIDHDDEDECVLKWYLTNNTANRDINTTTNNLKVEDSNQELISKSPILIRKFARQGKSQLTWSGTLVAQDSFDVGDADVDVVDFDRVTTLQDHSAHVKSDFPLHHVPPKFSEHDKKRSVEAGKLGIVRPMVGGHISPGSRATRKSASPSETHQLRGDEKYVFIDREDGEGFGFRLRPTDCKQFQVDDLDVHGVAHVCGALTHADVIRSMNGVDSATLQMSQAVDIIRNTTIQLVLKIQHGGLTNIVTKTINLEANKSSPYGFKFVHALQRPRFQGDSYIYVTKVYADTVASKQSLLVGDVITSINSNSIIGLRYEEVQHILKCTMEIGKGVRLEIHRAEYSSPAL